MNEIQAVKTAKIEEVKKNSKKGFTLVELVVVIAILAILAAIAIPVVASTIKSSQVSSAKSNAQTIELAIKEAQAAISSGDDSVFNTTSTGGNKASGGKLTIAEVAKAKKIESAVKSTYTLNGTTYACVWDKDSSKVFYVDKDGVKIDDIDKTDAEKTANKVEPGNKVPLTDTKGIVSLNVADWNAVTSDGDGE